MFRASEGAGAIFVFENDILEFNEAIQSELDPK